MFFIFRGGKVQNKLPLQYCNIIAKRKMFYSHLIKWLCDYHKCTCNEALSLIYNVIKKRLCVENNIIMINGTVCILTWYRVFFQYKTMYLKRNVVLKDNKVRYPVECHVCDTVYYHLSHRRYCSLFSIYLYKWTIKKLKSLLVYIVLLLIFLNSRTFLNCSLRNLNQIIIFI